MTAAELRAMTVGSVLACSPVVLVDKSGRRFEVVAHSLTCDKLVTDQYGQKKPGAVPVLTLTLAEVAE